MDGAWLVWLSQSDRGVLVQWGSMGVGVDRQASWPLLGYTPAHAYIHSFTHSFTQLRQAWVG